MSSIYSQICKEHNIKVVLISRSHSERIFNKNKRVFADERSLLNIKYEQLKASFGDSNILLATDNKDDFRYGNHTFIERDLHYLIGNDIPFSEVLEHLYEKIERKMQIEVDHLFITYPTCPTFTVKQYKKAIVAYYQNVVMNKDGWQYDSIMSVVKKKGFFWYNDKPLNYVATAEGHKYTQDITPVAEADNAIWGGPFDVLKEAKYLIGKNPYFFENDPIHAVDVDTPEDFELAQQIYAFVKGKEKNE